MNKIETKGVLYKAFKKTIEKVGIKKLKKTSLFGRNLK